MSIEEDTTIATEPPGRHHSMRLVFSDGSLASRSDADLLGRYIAGGESSGLAFEALLHRHGPMVWAVCRRTTSRLHEAEDAFQATFLVLARRAGSVRVDDSLGRWLYGVSRRIAHRAQVRARWATEGVGDPVSSAARPDEEAERSERIHLVGREVARMPRKYREAVTLCHLDGLTHDQAAEALGVAVGTVRSRLSRGREMLRERLVKRGFSPSTLMAFEAHRPRAEAVSGALKVAIRTASRIPAGGSSIGSATSAWLASTTLRSMMMTKYLTVFGACVLSSTLGVASLNAGQDIAGVTGRSDGAIHDPLPEARHEDPPAKPPTATEQLRKIVAEWDAACAKWYLEAQKAKTEAERNAIDTQFYPDELDYYRRCLELAAANPKNPGARDALIWVVTDGMRNNDAVGKRMTPLAQAVEILVRDFADEPRVARAALRVNNICSPNRTSFCRGLFERATNREAKGVACLALAQILETDATQIGYAHKHPVQLRPQIQKIDDAGKPYVVEGPAIYDDACWQSLRSRDEAATIAESEALYHRVIEEYADIPYNPWRLADGEVVANPHPRMLAEVAEGKLDDLLNLVVGKPAPEAEGVDLNGKPLKLSDHKGKVVLLGFWFAGCGPCMAAVPQERELAEKLKGRPFVLLGVNSDENLDTALKAVKDSGMTWPSFRDGSSGERPIANRYHIRAYPTVFVIDAQGIISVKQAGSIGLEEMIEKLVVEAETKQKP